MCVVTFVRGAKERRLSCSHAHKVGIDDESGNTPGGMKSSSSQKALSTTTTAVGWLDERFKLFLFHFPAASFQ